MGDCLICCDTLNKSTRRPVTCRFCDVAVCTTCVQRYLLSIDDPECMNCKKPWTNDMVDSALTRTFVYGPLKKHREDVLLNRERSLLPDTQLDVEAIAAQKVIREEIRKIEVHLGETRWRLHRCVRPLRPA